MALIAGELSYIFDFANGKSIKPNGTGDFKAFGANGVIGRSEDFNHEDGVIIGRVGAYCGAVARCKEKFWASDNTIVAYPKEESFSKTYAYYFLKSLDLNKYAGGSAQPLLTQTTLKKLAVKYHDNKSERDTIGGLLQKYDNLIENNNRRIAILEDMAQSLYREWFVKFRYLGYQDNLDADGSPKLVDSPLGQIPEGWLVKSAQDAITINPKTKLNKTTENPFVGMSGLAENSMVIDDVIQKKGNSGAKFVNGDTLFARITPCLQNGKTGYVQFLTEEQPVGFGSTEFIVLRESQDLSSEFIYLLSRSNNFREHAIQSMTGATGRQRVHNDCFASFYIAVPPRELMDEFTTLVSPMFKSIFNLSKRNENLKKQRDMLLPKLISGEIEL